MWVKLKGVGKTEGEVTIQQQCKGYKVSFTLFHKKATEVDTEVLYLIFHIIPDHFSN